MIFKFIFIKNFITFTFNFNLKFYICFSYQIKQSYSNLIKSILKKLQKEYIIKKDEIYEQKFFGYSVK